MTRKPKAQPVGMQGDAQAIVRPMLAQDAKNCRTRLLGLADNPVATFGEDGYTELDYVISAEESVIPIEVKSGATGQLKSMWSFLAAREAVALRGVRFSAQNFSTMPGLHSLPLYAVGSLAAALDESISEALLSVS